MVHALASLPAEALFPLFVVFGVALTIAFDIVVHRYVRPETRERASATAAVTLQVTATIYAILIAFVIVDEYSALRSAQSQVSNKSASLSIVFENSRAFPVAEGRGIRTAAIDYARVVVHRAFPQLEDTGEPDRRTDRRLEALFAAVQRVEPRAQSERAAYTAIEGALDEIVRTRSALIDSAGATVPATLFWMLFVIGFAVMGVATLLDTRHRGSHLLILSTLALVIWLTLALVVSLDYPFKGIIHVNDTPIRDFLAFRAAR
jgi:hypothetical protein